VVRVAAGVELIHTASLVHDDIMDEARLRRGDPTIFAEKGAARAITVGDYLFVKGYELAAMDLDPETIRLVADACAGLAEGQYKEEDLKEDPNDTALYLYVVENKTAGFIAACAELGAHLGGLRGKARAPYREFGYNLGVAFQLIDDVLDATGTVEKLGKDVGNDVRNGAKGGPAVFALQAEHAHLGHLVRDLYRTEGVDRTKQLAEAFAKRAGAAADGFADNAYSAALREVASVLLDRQH
jgi:geranylgeranyl pyrophosphate synthase